MCFMFGASKEQVRRMVGPVDEARHDEELTEGVLVSAAEDRSHN
ncbi:hypothetical protein [Lentzea sp. E54]